VRPIDWTVVAVYMTATLAIGLWLARRASRSLEDFFVGGRTIPWWLAGASMAAITFSVDTPLYVSGLVIGRGIAGNWEWWSFVVAHVSMIYLFARLWRRAGILTDYELTELRYGRKAAAVLRGTGAFLFALPINAISIAYGMLAMRKVADALGIWTQLGLVGDAQKVQAVVLIVVLGAALAALLVDTDAQTERATDDRVVAVASTVAAAPSVRAAVTASYPAGQEISGPSAAMQGFAEDVRAQTNADFVVVMTPGGIRYTHPDPTQIGQEYLGSRDAALAGGIGVETYTGTLGPSVRAIAPVRDNGAIVALVAVGVTVDHLDQATRQRLLVLGIIAAGALLIGVVGSLLIARWVRRQTLGMGPRELARVFTYYDAVLASVHEGMVLLDGTGRIVSVNSEGRRLLGLTDDAIGRTGRNHERNQMFLARVRSGAPRCLTPFRQQLIPRRGILHRIAEPRIEGRGG